jgi:hypothetical protein
MLVVDRLGCRGGNLNTADCVFGHASALVEARSGVLVHARPFSWPSRAPWRQLPRSSEFNLYYERWFDNWFV